MVFWSASWRNTPSHRSPHSFPHLSPNFSHFHVVVFLVLCIAYFVQKKIQLQSFKAFFVIFFIPKIGCFYSYRPAIVQKLKDLPCVWKKTMIAFNNQAKTVCVDASSQTDGWGRGTERSWTLYFEMTAVELHWLCVTDGSWKRLRSRLRTVCCYYWFLCHMFYYYLKDPEDKKHIPISECAHSRANTEAAQSQLWCSRFLFSFYILSSKVCPWEEDVQENHPSVELTTTRGAFVSKQSEPAREMCACICIFVWIYACAGVSEDDKAFFFMTTDSFILLPQEKQTIPGGNKMNWPVINRRRSLLSEMMQ